MAETQTPMNTRTFQEGDLIIYGSTGVCRVDSVMKPDREAARHGFDRERTYYVLKPLYHSETIYVPTDNEKVFMRPVIEKEEAQRLIDMIPTITAEAIPADSPQELRNYYRSVTTRYDCSDLIELTMSIYAKKKFAEGQRKKFGEVDGKAMKQAEDMLFGEFAVALQMDKDKVPEYIAKRVEEIRRTRDKE
ncbi:MAG: CarD family transcriptional regulator [Firmicutes bacterium]|nr:CarD family transcriptional regulator [Bacillota bacterium]